MNPFGGAPARYEDRDESIRAAASYFAGGEARLELVWRVVHRHADPLVRDIGLDQAAALARG